MTVTCTFDNQLMSTSVIAPIALFVYNRPDHARRTVDALKINKLAKESDLVIYSDAPKRETQADKVREVRQYIRQVDGFKSVTIIERVSNFGLAHSIIDGVTTMVNKYGRIIVLEDDMVTSAYFLEYMNEALAKYEDDDRVVSIHGYVYPVKQPMPEAFFLLGADCWGWATWQRGWAVFNSDGQYLLDELRKRKLTRTFDFNGAYPFTKMLEQQIKGQNDSWAIRWYASALLAGKLTLYPKRSFVHNIGFDGSGNHCGVTDVWGADLITAPINLNGIAVEPSILAWRAFEIHFRSARKFRVWNLLRGVLNAIGLLSRSSR